MKQINFVEMSVICGGCEEAVEAVLETTEVVVAPVFKILRFYLVSIASLNKKVIRNFAKSITLSNSI